MPPVGIRSFSMRIRLSTLVFVTYLKNYQSWRRFEQIQFELLGATG